MQGKMIATNVVYRMLHVSIVFAINMVLSRLAGVSGYGMLSLLIANVSIFNLISGLGAEAGISYTVASRSLSAGKLMSFVVTVTILQLLLLGVAEFLCWSITGHFLLFNTTNTGYWWLGVLFLLGVSVAEKYTALLNGHRLFTLCNKILVISHLLVLAIFVLLFFLGDNRHPVFYIGTYVLLNLLQAVLLVIAYHGTANNRFKLEQPAKADRRNFFSYSLFAFGINIIQFIAYRIDYWLLDFYKGEEQLGWYSLAVKLAQLFWVLPLLFASMILPGVASGSEQFNQQRVVILLRVMNTVNIGVGIAGFFIIPFLVPWFFGADYTESSVLLQLLLPGFILFCIATLLAAWFAGKKMLRINFYGSLLCLVSVCLLDLLLIPSMGMKGAAIASSIGYGIVGIYFMIVYSLTTHTAIGDMFRLRRADLQYIRSIFRLDSKK